MARPPNYVARRRLFGILCALLVLLTMFLQSLIHRQPMRLLQQQKYGMDKKKNIDPDPLVVVYIGCGSYVDSVLTSVKSILLAHRAGIEGGHSLVIAIYVDQFDHVYRVQTVLDSWNHPPGISTLVKNFDTEDKRFNGWRRCASTRLYFDELLPTSWKKVLYLDADTLVRKDLSPLWRSFVDDFRDDETMFAISDEFGSLYTAPDTFLGGGGHNVPNGTCGFNSGVMLFDMEKVRRSFSQRLREVQEYVNNHDDIELHFIDQDIFTLMAYLNPRVYTLLDCKWNYRTDFWKEPHKKCSAINMETASILHGSRGVFQSNKTFHAPWKEAHDAIRNSTAINKQ